MLHPATIRDFLAHGTEEMTPRSVANLKRLLTRTSERLMPEYARRDLPGPGRIDPLAPYTDAEVAALRAWAYGQPTANRRVQAERLLCLGLGAGMFAAEIAAIVVADLRVDDLGVLITVSGARARQIPVRVEWSEPLIRVIESNDRTDHVFLPGRKRTRNLISNFASAGSGEPGPNSYRMRSTWIVGHLVNAVPVHTLMDAAGIESVQGLSKFVAHIPTAEVDAVRRALHGAREDR
ncbi:hypothetical protein [Nocardia camponoti]|uniref:Uncharacterized protein n=1 Tax=Nocardia camponoti TaxID=1616106 RepID=A0A917QKE7_9NOCA|nr:hypothetical protein [Nocardia camponoti]GGK54833.1 hypothetical protein GCM10011591_28360 [Nocardia camponoti]